MCSLLSLACAVELARTVSQGSSPNRSIDDSQTSVASLWASTKSLGLLFWVVAVMCVGGYSSILPFTSVFVALKPHGLSQDSASQTVSIAFLMCALLTPVIGRFVDRFGRAGWVASASCFLLCLTHSMFTHYDHVLVMAILGLAYAGFVASIWPLVPLTVEESHVGLAYGIMTALQNMGLTVLPLLVCHS